MSIQEKILYSASLLCLCAGIAILVRARRGKRNKRNMRIGWWHADSQVLRDMSFEHRKKHENDPRGGIWE
jgi:hypothetical protein